MRESTIYQEIWQEAKAEERQEVALNLLREGITVEIIARVTGLSVEQVQQLQTSISTNSDN